jgi:hypothetical protein
MTVHVLDTSAIYLLLNKHRPPLLATLETVAANNSATAPQFIRTPSVVLVEVGQARAPAKKRLGYILALAPVFEDLNDRIATMAADGLRQMQRQPCPSCSGFIRPTLVDAVVMALAADWAEGDRTIVYTQDDGDMNLLRAAYFPKVVVQKV